MTIVKFKKVNPNAERPRKAHPTDAGYDLTVVSGIKVNSGLYEYNSGIALELPEGHCALIFPRSSVSNTGAFLANSIGLVDQNFRGEIKVRFYATSAPYGLGERMAQLVILPLPSVVFEEVEKLGETDRNVGGFGSTGK